MKMGITGHRPHKLGNDYDLTSDWILKIGKKLQHIVLFQKPREMWSGMALGIDELWAELAIMESVPLVAVIPFKGQELKWPEKSQRVYQNYLRLANRIIVVDMVRTIMASDNPELEAELTAGISYNEYLSMQVKQYSPVKMEMRNRYLVNHVNKLVGVWDGTEGGTANCIRYARTVMPHDKIQIIDPLQYKTVTKT